MQTLINILGWMTFSIFAVAIVLFCGLALAAMLERKFLRRDDEKQISE